MHSSLLKITYGGHERVDEKGEYQHHHELLPLTLSIKACYFSLGDIKGRR